MTDTVQAPIEQLPDVTLPAGACIASRQQQLLWLLPQRAVYWPDARMLIIADVHLGKEAVFQLAGMAIPTGPTAGTLQRLHKLLSDLRPLQLLVLGDLVHALPGHDESWPQALQRLLECHPQTTMTVVAGNHDVDGVRERLPAQICWHQQLVFGPWHFCHEPSPEAQQQYVMCGHLHPSILLQDPGARSTDRLRMPVFWFGTHQLVLPAFGEFTGTHRIIPARSDKVYGVGPDVVVQLQ